MSVSICADSQTTDHFYTRISLAVHIFNFECPEKFWSARMSSVEVVHVSRLTFAPGRIPFIVTYP